MALPGYVVYDMWSLMWDDSYTKGCVVGVLAKMPCGGCMGFWRGGVISPSRHVR